MVNKGLAQLARRVRMIGYQRTLWAILWAEFHAALWAILCAMQ